MFGKDKDENQNKIEQLEEAIEKLEARVVELESVLEIEPEKIWMILMIRLKKKTKTSQKKEPVF
jgi:hypothetical protein